jgi:PII-like signaling protein
VSHDCLKLTTYFGERARAGGAFLADALVDISARHELQTSLVLRGIEGFGSRHHLRTDRLLTLSEDLPMVAVAVDRRARIDRVLDDIRALPRFTGLITLERARMLTDSPHGVPAEPGATKLTVYLGRQERFAGRPAAEATLDLLHRRGIAGATVLLGVDGTVHGVRQRARFFARNGEVPLMVVAIGDRDRIAGVLPELHTSLPRPLVTLEAVQLCKRDGRALAAPRALPDRDPSGLPVHQMLTVFASEQSQHGGRPLHRELVRALRAEGAAGATSLRGVRGYHGDHAPHGDSFWQLRRHVPVVVSVIDRPSQIQRWFATIDRLTDETGLVTSEMVPALQLAEAGTGHGGLPLAAPLP